MSEDAPIQKAAAAGSDVGDRVSLFFKRPNLATRQMELVRRSDGQALDRRPMTRQQRQQYGVEKGDSMGGEIRDLQAFIGQQYGSLTVVSAAAPDDYDRARLNVRCVCAQEFTTLATNLTRQLTTSCGFDCPAKLKTPEPPAVAKPEREEAKMAKTQKAAAAPVESFRAKSWQHTKKGSGRGSDITGQSFGSLTAIRFTGKRDKNSNQIWLFRCVCGNERECLKTSVRQNKSTKCQCERKRKSSKASLVVKNERQKKVEAIAETVKAIKEEAAKPMMAEPVGKQVNVTVKLAIKQPDFFLAVRKTGRQISSFITLAETIPVSEVEQLVEEMQRVASSPFAAIPEGALEQATAFLTFRKSLEQV